MESKIIRYPVGIQTFSEIISEGYLYVDKTGLIYDMVSRNKYVFLCRPRRFGKSLLISTLDAYFRGKKELFEGLAIYDMEQQWETFPVFRFDLSGENYDDISRLLNRLNRCIDDIAEEYGVSADGHTVSDRFGVLIKRVCKSTGKKVVILIDEYDKPMLDCLHEDALHEKMKAELRGFYSVIKATDEYVKFSMLTGVTRFSKVSVFSGINNLSDISLLPKYNAICGISESEFHCYFADSIKEFAQSNNYSPERVWLEFKKMYDGYHFADSGEFIYNPYSVLNAFKDERLGSYWFTSGSPRFLIKLIEKHSYPLDSLEGEKRSEMELTGIHDLTSDLVILLFETGYLTIKDYDSSTRTYTLGFPNKEVYDGFWDSLSSFFFKGYDGRSVLNLKNILDDVLSGRPEEYMRRIQSLLADLAYGTERKSESLRRNEGHFRDIMAIIMKLLGLHVRTEIHSSAGRRDMQILTDRYVYIFEYKIDSNAEKALEQIQSKGYWRPFAAEHRQIFLIGANFSTSTRTLTDWKIETL